MRPYLADVVGITHPTMTDPKTGAPFRAIGVTKRGWPIWPVLGASPDDPSNGPGDSGGQDDDQGGNGNAGQSGDAVTKPLAEMTEAEQLAYWKSKSRKHEDRSKAQAAEIKSLADKARKYDEHLAATQTETEKAIADAKAAGRSEALVDAGTKLVQAYVTAAVKSRLDADKAKSVAAGLNAANFLGDDNLPDTDRIDEYLSALLPATPSGVAGSGSGPDMGQGRRASGKATGVAAGAALFAERNGKRAGAAIAAANNS